MVIGYEESKEDLLVQTATYGEKKTFSFAELWNTGFEERGGMVLYDLDFENPDFLRETHTSIALEFLACHAFV